MHLVLHMRLLLQFTYFFYSPCLLPACFEKDICFSTLKTFFHLYTYRTFPARQCRWAFRLHRHRGRSPGSRLSDNRACPPLLYRRYHCHSDQRTSDWANLYQHDKQKQSRLIWQGDVLCIKQLKSMPVTAAGAALWLSWSLSLSVSASIDRRIEKEKEKSKKKRKRKKKKKKLEKGRKRYHPAAFSAFFIYISFLPFHARASGGSWL